ncbi:negative regulator of beta-lactamase expression [Synechococcus sp. PCC 7502]|uniref:peptidoglycan recognition protein family protein n=1 Tax=Synechococcus sp. PCC 7502 TaxID=1173263 RepID=UPI00029F9DC6|nr:peptidoglycan recognition family protein [Synechococcus sp. PCC 7502]AFY72409.1 negative regulator of beta-lactamase expression [Synechococcus sp. PCC 7502]
MQQKQLVAIAIFFLTLLILMLLAKPANITPMADAEFTKVRLGSPKLISQRISPKKINFFPSTNNLQDIYFLSELNQSAPTIGCKTKPPTNPSLAAKLTSTPITLERFRRVTPISEAISTQPPSITYSPREIIALAAASNYGDRYLKDVSGKPANYPPIIVLHETVAPANTVINYFQAFETDEDYQASYHTLIALDGTIIYFVPPDKRAFGAGNSVFVSPLGKETVKTNVKYSSSVNNFAYHISLETPEDGLDDELTHRGYTKAQYQSLGWLVAKTNVSLERITTHRKVDRSHSRIDPRSFNFKTFENWLSKFPRTNEIVIGCPLTRPEDIIDAGLLMTQKASE